MDNIEQCLRVATRRLARAATQADQGDAEVEARSEAEALLAHALGRNRSWLYAWGDALPTAAEREAFEALLTRRLAGEPVAYLIGRRGFWTLDLQVTADTLIPRPETECLVELALARLPADRASAVADLGTGSGAIALALAAERPRAQVLATDASSGALAVARANAAAHRLRNVTFAEGDWGDWFGPLQSGRFDLIASNPPYIAEGDAHLQRGDLRHEPATALSSGADGLDAIRAIVAGAPAHLLPGGWLLLEHGWDQGDALRGLLRAVGFIAVETVQDLERRDRVSLGRLPDAMSDAAAALPAERAPAGGC